MRYSCRAELFPLAVKKVGRLPSWRKNLFWATKMDRNEVCNSLITWVNTSFNVLLKIYRKCERLFFPFGQVWPCSDCVNAKAGKQLKKREPHNFNNTSVQIFICLINFRIMRSMSWWNRIHLLHIILLTYLLMQCYVSRRSRVRFPTKSNQKFQIGCWSSLVKCSTTGSLLEKPVDPLPE